MENQEQKETSWIVNFSVDPVEQSPAKLAKHITGIMRDIIVQDECIDDNTRDRIYLLDDMLHPILNIIEENEKCYTELLKK